MAQGIVKVTPRPGSPGTLRVTVAASNNNEVRVGDTISFPNPGFPVTVGQTVNINIINSTTCSVISNVAS